MKKFLYFTSAAALALVSCSDEFTPNNNNDVVLEGKSRIVATYPLGNAETRTSLENNGQTTGYNYLWTTGDAISVFGSDPELYVENAMYVYANVQSAVSGNFVGQVNLEDGEEYYGIYPYNPDLTANEDGTYTVAINRYQNFNSKANVNWSDSKANGSFANGEAPAVAVADAANDELDFTFQPLASYLVFPMTGVGTVNTVSLQITLNGETEPVALCGTFDVDPTAPQAVTVDDLTGEDNTTITVNCGSGVQLSATQPTNFWFVVPTGIKLAGATVTLTVNENMGEGKGAQTLSKTFSDSWIGSNGSNQTLVNDVRWIWMSKETAFQYNPTGAYMITKPWQFLEYAYAVSTDPATVMEQYQALSGKNLTDYNYNYTDLENIVKDFDPEADSYTEVNPAVIVGNVNVTTAAIQSYLSGVNLNGLAPYYQSVYVNYIKNGYIRQIGGEVGFTLSGQEDDNEVPGTLSGLTVVGNGMFPGASDSELAQNVNDLVLNNVTVNATGVKGKFVNFLASPNNSNFKNVTINSNCQLLAANGVEKGVFTTIANAYISVADVDNYATENIPFFANQLSVIQAIVGGSYAFDFTQPGRGIDAFNAIVMAAPESYSSVFLVNDETAATSLMTGITNTNKYAYSVIGNDANDELTSFWTGYATTNNLMINKKYVVTAEWLAYAVNNSGVVLPEFTVNMNLLNKRWYNAGLDVTVVGNNHYISNVNIDGTKDGTNSVLANGGYNYMTLFGNYSTITNLTVNNVSLAPNAKATGMLVVAALSTGPLTTAPSSNISVNNLTVDVTNAKADFVDDTMGGLYFRLTEAAFQTLTVDKVKTPVLSGLTVTKVGGYTNGFGCGYLAGSLEYNLAGNSATITNPCSMAGHTEDIFGMVDINLSKQTGQTTVLTLNGFGSDFINEDNINEYVTTDATSTYFLRLYQDSTTSSTLWEYNGKLFAPAVL